MPVSSLSILSEPAIISPLDRPSERQSNGKRVSLATSTMSSFSSMLPGVVGPATIGNHLVARQDLFFPPRTWDARQISDDKGINSNR